MRYTLAVNATAARPAPQPALVAPNSFKGTLSAARAAEAIAAGVRRAWPGTEIVLKPQADGGDGFLETLLVARGGHRTEHLVSGPLGSPVTASVGWLPEETGECAVIEAASACGLALLPAPGPASAAWSSTRGLGELIGAALRRGPVRILVGLGGTASTDGGAGVGQVLGYKLLDRAGHDLVPGGLGLLKLDRIEAPGSLAALKQVPLVAACDVTNPLLGATGAAAVYGPQKGADLTTVKGLEQALRRLAAVADRDLGASVAADAPGAGAAGGLGFGLVRFCGATLEPGAQLVARATGLDQALDRCRVVFTGEGRFDRQSLEGKATGEVVRRAAERGLTCVVLAGSAEPEAVPRLQELGGIFVQIGTRPGQSGRGSRAARDLAEATTRACLKLPPS